jgi:hypothetical protein
MAKLTTRTLASGVTGTDLIHIVITGDTSQDPDGSSYKATIQQVFDAYPSVSITGGTYNSGTGTITITNSTGGTVSITGITSGSVFTGGTVPGATIFNNGVTANTMSASTLFVNGVQITGDTYVTGGTFNIDSITFTNNQGGTFIVTGITTGSGSVFTGGTVTGPTNFTNGLSANTISATTYYNLPGSSSGNCFIDFYVRNVHGCSPISIWDETQTRASNAYGELSFALGNLTETWGDFSYTNGQRTRAGSDNGYLVNSCTNGVCILDSSYGDITGDYTTGNTSVIVFDDMDYSANYSTYSSTVSAATFNGTNTIIHLNDISVNTFGQPGIISNTKTPNQWTGNEVFGGKFANANGNFSIAIGEGSSAQGNFSYSVGNYSSANNTSTAYGPYSFSEGKSTTTYGVGSHAEGDTTFAIGDGSHAEGGSTIATGNYSHAEGSNTQAIGMSSHAEGTYSVASGQYSHSEGSSTASGIFSHAQGDSTTASGQYSHSQNKGTLAYGSNSHAGGVGSRSGELAISHGELNYADGDWSVVLGGRLNTVDSGDTSGSTIVGSALSAISGVSVSDPVYHSGIFVGSGNTITSFLSAIIGGINNNVSAPGTVILGGNSISGISSDTTYVPNFIIKQSYTPTNSSDPSGEPGSITWDNTYLYYKTNTGWRRLNGSTF